MPEQNTETDNVNLPVKRNDAIIIIRPHPDGEGFTAASLLCEENNMSKEEQEFYKALTRGMCTIAVIETDAVMEAAKLPVGKVYDDEDPEELPTPETDLSKIKPRGSA